MARGDFVSLTIVGAADADRLAAFAEVFFELSMLIISGAEGKVLHGFLASARVLSGRKTLNLKPLSHQSVRPGILN